MADKPHIQGVEVRAAVAQVTTAGRRLEGWAALFDTPAAIGTGADGFREVIRVGAFRAAIAPGNDVLCLADHDPTRVLGRTRSGTLRLSEHAKGLAFSLDVPDTQAGRDMLFLAQRGDLGGCSFGFTVPPGGDAWGEYRSRELLTVNLHEISVVSAFPAYAGTTVQARARCNADPARERERFLSSI